MKTETSYEPFVTTEQAAEFFGKPVSWLHNQAKELDIPRYKIGNQMRYRISELEAWAQSQRVGATQ